MNHIIKNTKVKICGVTNLDDALMAAEFGADALGFVFAPSKRKITPEKANEIIKKLPPFVVTFGIFMDEEEDVVRYMSDLSGIDIVQLHGKESSSYCRQMTKRVVKRIQVVDDDTKETIMNRMKPYNVSAFLFDPGAGEGKVFDWEKAVEIDQPIIIAGGLNPENVKEVVQRLNPYGVDVSTGVESEPGKKDPKKVKRFIEEVKC
jgi:phosphoribosylanthranilate isomerase